MTPRWAFLIAALVVALAPPAAARCRGRHWVGAWGASPSGALGGVFADRSLRLVVHPTLGGRRVRVRLSNRFGTDPVRFGAVTIGRRGPGADVVPGTLRRLRFGRQRSVTIPAGGEVVSDQRPFRFDAFDDLVVSLHVVGSAGPATAHVFSLQTSYASAAGSGDHTGEEEGGAFSETIGSWPYLIDVEVRAPRRVGAVVALGDSITDGFGGPPDQNVRYPDLLARRAADAGLRLAVQNAGIGGNTVARTDMESIFGPNLLARLEADALQQAGARVVLLMEGTNDIGLPPPGTAAEVIAGLEAAVERLRNAGLRVVLGTIPPCRDYLPALHGTPEAIAKRNEINAWIRTTDVADGMVDFHAVLRDPADPDRLLAAYDSGDHLHPNAAGYAAMADAVDLPLFADLPCR